MTKAFYPLALTACLLLAACSGTKHLPPGEKLYTGARVDLRNASGLTARERKTLHADLVGITRPQPNTRFLGLPIKLGFYNMFRKAKPNSFFGRLRDQLGEPPVLLSSVNSNNSVKLLQNHMDNKGFFQAKASGDSVVKGRKARMDYKVDAGPQYTINAIRFPLDSTELSENIRASQAGSLLQVGAPYDLDVIRGERNRVDAFLKERGFYFFNPEYLLMQVDSTVGNNKVDMVLTVKNSAPDEAMRAYRIRNTYIYANYRINAQRLDTSLADAELYGGYHIIDRRKRFKPWMWPRILVFDSGALYNRTDHNTTLSRLINLNEFRYVKNRFEPVTDSFKLDAYYYLTPQPKKSIRGEITATSKSNNMNGSQINLTWRNRNTFRQAEHLAVSAYVASEIQFGGTFQGYNTYRTGAEATLAIPRFVVPFFNVNTTSAYVPRTNIQLGYDLLTRNRLYTVNSFRGSLGYTWKPSLEFSHELNPVSINYVQPINVTAEYRDSVRRYPYLQRVVDSQFILGSTYQVTFNQLVNGLQRPNAFFVNGLVDLSGNVAGLMMGANAKGGDPKRIFNALFDQYIKLEVDGRWYHKIGLKSSWVNRVNIGYGIPYGNSMQLPYIKQFFAGGNNSLRGFRSRSLGPGTFRQPTRTFLADQTGDIKFEFNTEFRPHISGPLYGALFIDAGNIWLANEDPDRPGSGFSGSFFNELAVNTGVGVRLDVTIFVIRLDVGIPLVKPWEKNPWVMDRLDPKDPALKKENIIYNLAIGYPF
ncbi:BamA/TamA family outer membrane protein [Flaviaesturariibacter amylovorans]|uniref:BamA/TamA family outer membrane protein n=1 Tax=Flaviaesturariibacter amylovorans TaxID=1084520 RepID=A0ABP8GJJ1_9BACT